MSDNKPQCPLCGGGMVKVVRMDYKTNDIRVLLHMCRECLLWASPGASSSDLPRDASSPPLFRMYNKILQHPEYKDGSRKWFFSEKSVGVFGGVAP